MAYVISVLSSDALAECRYPGALKTRQGWAWREETLALAAPQGQLKDPAGDDPGVAEVCRP